MYCGNPEKDELEKKIRREMTKHAALIDQVLLKKMIQQYKLLIRMEQMISFSKGI